MSKLSVLIRRKLDKDEEEWRASALLPWTLAGSQDTSPAEQNPGQLEAALTAGPHHIMVGRHVL